MTEAKSPTRETYHYGNLAEDLIAAAAAQIAEHGVDNLSVREVAKRAGVSPGAPFRHFSSKKALLTAVAEQAMERLSTAVQGELNACSTDDPIEGLRAIGRAYLSWAVANPTHFQVISSRTLIDFDASERLVSENEAIRLMMVELVERAQKQGRLRSGVATADLIFASRALVYGLARMWIDGHLGEWKVEGPPAQAMAGALDLFIGSLGADGGL